MINNELSKPVAYTDADELRFHHATSDMWPVPLGFGKDVPLYSQEYVSALEKVAQYWVGQSYEWKQHAEAVEKRIAGLESEITNVIGNHAKSATEPRVLLAKLGLLPDEIDDFALQVIGINKKNIYIPKPIFIPQEDIRVYLNADILITCLEKQDLILSHY